MRVECIKGQGEYKDTVLGVVLATVDPEEASFLASLLDLGALVTKGETTASVVISPALTEEEEPEEKPAAETTLETGKFIG